jgi:mycofactocin system glycosyltransferase
MGGEPYAVRLVEAADEAALDALLGGAPVGPHGVLARALVATNLAQPVPPVPPVPAGPAGPAAGSLPGSAVTSEGGEAPAQVAVVVPVRNRPAALGRLLVALAAEGDPRIVEVVVVDDVSDDGGATGRAGQAHKARVVRRDRRGGPGAARNTGLAATGAELVAFLDSDCLPRPGWLEPLLGHLGDPLVALVAPRVVPLVEGEGVVARYEAARSPLDRGPSPARVVPGGAVPFVPGTALLARRSALGDGFDEGLPGGEDVDLAWRLHEGGWHVRYEPAGQVAHDHPCRLATLLDRRLRYGRAAVPLARAHNDAAPPVAVSPWTLAAWGALGMGRPGLAGAILAGATGLAARRLRLVVPSPAVTALRVAGLGSLASWRAVADAAVRSWLPLSCTVALAVPRARAALLAAALAPPLEEWRTRRPPLSPAAWTGLRLLDDAAYGLGTWYGGVRDGRPDLLVWPVPWGLSIEPLRPDARAATDAPARR